MRLVKAVPWHVASIRERLSPESSRSCAHVYGVDIRLVLDLTWRFSQDAVTLIDGELPIIIAGVYESELGVGNPWTFLSREVAQHRIACAWWSLFVLDHFQRRYGILELYLDCENTRSIRWHRWMGFHLDPPAPHGPLGAMCVRGRRIAEV
jgi:hypothetical protein